MTDLPLALRDRLAQECSLFTTTIRTHRTSSDGTEKLLLELPDGHLTECVLLRDGHRRTICISSQVGCAMGCVFCASGLDGVARSLTRGEIVQQMLQLAALLPAEERLAHVVVMGMGEPLANLDPVLAALAEATDESGLGISARRITISTVGLPAGIRRLVRLGCRYNLAVSLHAATDALRRELVGAHRSLELADILDAADEYFDASGRRLTFEYVLLGDTNDRPQHAHALARLLAGRAALVNLIPYNAVAQLDFRPPSRDAIERFTRILTEHGLNVQVRQRKGHEIDAACGQLRRQALDPGGEPLAIAPERSPGPAG